LLYMHLPFEVLPFAVLAFFPLRLAYAIWFICNVGLLLSALLVLRPYLPGLKSETASGLLYVATFLPLLLALCQGQDSLMLLLIWALTFTSIQKGRDQRAGRILALASFKPQFLVPTLLMFLIARNWKFFVGFLESALLLFAVSLAIVGWDGFMKFPQLV